MNKTRIINGRMMIMMFETFHMVSALSILLLVLFIHTSEALLQNSVGRFPFLMPNVRPYRPELYLCTPIKVDYTNDYYIVGFEPNATMNTAHHMLLYGCGKPGSKKPVWNCGEMALQDKESKAETASPCRPGEHSQIMYAWGRDAPKLELPEGVGFKVGESSPIKYIVLQVHYAHVHQFADGRTDDSGIFIHYTKEPMPKQAGVFLMGTSGVIPPARKTLNSIEPTIEHMEVACDMNENIEIHPFAFRTHTHSLGKVVSGYRVRNGQWELLGRQDPMKPQMFYPVKSTEPIRKGDILAARCTMASDRLRPTYIGATNDDEMCNFYLMYWSYEEPLERKYCFSAGPPTYYWQQEGQRLQNIPDADASRMVD